MASNWREEYQKAIKDGSAAKRYQESSKRISANTPAYTHTGNGKTGAAANKVASGKRTTGDGATRLDQVMAAAINSTLSAYQKAAADATSASGSLSMGESARAAIEEAASAKKENRQIKLGQAQRKAEQEKKKRIESGWTGDLKQALISGSKKSAESAYESEKQAKEGLGGFGQGVVDFGIAGAQFAGDALLNTVAPGSGMAAMAGRAYGSASLEAEKKGLTGGQQQISGLKSAAIEMLTEKLFGSVSKVAYGKGIIKNESLVNGLVNRLAKTDKGRTALKVLVGANEEGMEEVLSDILNPIADRILKLDDGKGDWSDLGDDMDTQQMLADYIIGGALGLVGAGTNVVSGQYKAENAQQRGYEKYQKELVNMGLEAEPGSKTQKTAEAYKTIVDNSGKHFHRNLSDAETENLTKLLASERDAPLVRSSLENANILIDDNTADIIARAANGQRISQSEKERLQKIPNIGEVMGEVALAGTKAKALERTFEQELQPNNETDGITLPRGDEMLRDKTIESAERLSKLTGREIKLYDADPSENGYYDRTTGELYINRNSKNPMAQVVGHELTHSIEGAGAYTDLKSVIFSEIQKQGGDLAKMREEKAALYEKHGHTLGSEEEIDAEIVAEFVEKNLLTDEASIKAVVTQSPSLGQRILQFINDLLAKIGNKKAQERAFLMRARGYYQKALKETENRPVNVTFKEEAPAQTAQTTQETPAQEAGPAREAPAQQATQETAQETQPKSSDIPPDEYLKSLRDQLANGEISEEEYSDLFDEYYNGGTERQYSFAGKKASTANLEHLKNAQEMETLGADMESIRKATGWFKGRDGKWRFEIDDSKAEFRRDGDARLMQEEGYQRMQALTDKWIASINDGTEFTEAEQAEMEQLGEKYYDAVWEEKHMLTDFLKHDELFEAYPRLKGVALEFDELPAGANGFFSKRSNTIVLSDKLFGKSADTLIHEIQHIIQNYEGFAKGSNPRYWNERMENGYSKRWSTGKEMMPGELYRNTAGEIEARDAASRRTLTPEERKSKAPDLGDENTVFAEDGKSYSINNTRDKTISEQLKEYRTGRMTSHDEFYYGAAPAVLDTAGLNGRPLVMSQTDFKKAKSQKHNVPTRAMTRLTDSLSDPILSFATGDKIGILTKDIDGDGKPLLVAISKNVDLDGETVNRIKSAYGLDNPQAWIKNQLSEGKELRIFDNKKADSFLDEFGYLAERPKDYRLGDIVTGVHKKVKSPSQQSVNKQYSVSERTPEQKKEILAQARRYASGEISKDEFFNHVDSIDGTRRMSAPRRRADSYPRMQSYSDEAREIYDRAHSEGVSVDEYLRRNWEEFDIDGRWSDAAQEALRMDGRRYSVSGKSGSESVEAAKYLQGMSRKSVNDFTPADIEKTRPFAEKYWREMGAKSPFFRAWFGDWRANDKTVVHAISVGQGNFKAGKATNMDTGVTLSWGDVLKKETIIHQPSGGVASRALGAIEDIVENAILLDTYTSSLSSKTKLPGTAFMHSYYTVVNYEGTDYLLKLFAEEAVSLKNGEIFTRAYELKDIKKVAVLPDGVLSKNGGLTDGNTSTTLTVADIAALVKKYDKSYNPKPASKVVNPDGTPMVVYHGTDDTFWKFDTNKISDREGSFFFAQNREDAEAYSGSGHIMEAYVNLQNPIDYNEMPSEIYKLQNKKAQVEALKKMGYDGWLADMDTGWGEISAFYPEQIKSATDNIGTFDSSNPDIRYSVTEEAVDLSDISALSERIGNTTGAKKYNIIRDFIMDELSGQPIVLSDGRRAVVDRSDALHIANKAHNKKTAEIAQIRKIAETAQLAAEEASTKDGKFDHFYYYEAPVKYRGETFNVYLNVGVAKNDATSHIYDITQKLRDTAQPVAVGRLSKSFALGNGISDNNISESGQFVNASSEEASRSGVRDTIPKKAETYLKRAENNLVKDLSDKLNVPKFAQREYLNDIAQEISEEYLKTGTVSEETKSELFETAWENGRHIDDEFYNAYKDIKDYLRTQSITLSETDKADITDWNQFKNSAFGTLRIVNSGGLPVDTAYQELQGMAPELFPFDIAHPADQIQRMLEVGKSISVSEKSLNDHFGKQAEEYKKWARADFETAVTDNLSALRTVKRYVEDGKAPAEKLHTIDEVREAYKGIKEARKKYEIANARNLLTDHDKMLVGRLLRGEIEPQHLDPEKDNVKGITAVFEAQEEYERISRTLREWNAQRKQELRDEADEYLQTANDWKDKKSGILYARETQERNILDIVPDEKIAKAINRKYFMPVHQAEAMATQFKKTMRGKVAELKLSTKETKAMEKAGKVSEAHAVQLIGEARDNAEMARRSRDKMRDGKTEAEWKAIEEDLWKNNPELDKAKIENAIKEFRKIYDELLNMMNDVRIKNGYEPVNYRKGYFPHFKKDSADNIIGLFGRALGIKTDVTELPTTINGMTHMFRPGIQWFGNALERTGFETTYDAVEGFDRYIEGVANVIYQTENIQRLRALATQARYRTGPEGLRKQIDAVRADTGKTEAEKKAIIDDLYANGKYALSNWVVNLDEYTNILAGKKSMADRNLEQALGRDMYNVVKAVESRVAANMVAINVGSWLTNFIPITQGYALLGTKDLLVGMQQTLAAMKTSDGMVEASAFLTNRRGSDPLVQTWAQKASAKLSSPMSWIDNFTAGTLVRGRYNQNIRQGMSEAAAMEDADTFAANVMADRSKGSTPTLFNQSNPVTKLFTQFQLEVNNQLSYLFKDVPRDTKDKGVKALALALLKFFLGAYLYNEVYEHFIGRRPALDPIGILVDTAEDIANGESAYDVITGTLEDTAEQLPFIGGILGGGRIPISSALPDAENLLKAATNDDWDSKKRWSTIGKELAKPATYTLLPFGGGQIKKIAQGVDATIKGGSYTYDADGNDILQYPVFNDSVGDKIKSIAESALFGKTTLPTGREWIGSGFKNFSAKETAAYKELTESGTSQKEVYEVLEAVRGEKTNNGKRTAISDSSLTDNEKRILYNHIFGEKQENGTYKSTRTEEIAAFKEAGLDMDDFLKAQNQYTDIGKEYDTASDKALAFSRWVNQQSWTADQKTAVNDCFKYYSQIPATAANYNKLAEAGLSDENAYKLAKAINDLEPLDGAETVSNMQKWRTVVDTVKNENDQLAALAQIMPESEYKKVSAGRTYGVSPSSYVTFKEALPKFDTDGNGTFKQAEIKAAIDAMGVKYGTVLPGGSKLTTTQQAVLWQLANKSWKPKNNPYSVAIGQKVYNALNAK